MSYTLQNRLDYLGTRMAEINKATITYRRGPDSVSVQASPIRVDPDALIEYGIVLDIERKDFVINSTDLILSGITAEPEPGDTIESDGMLFRVVPPGEGAPAYEYTTSSRRRMRVHTELVE